MQLPTAFFIQLRMLAVWNTGKSKLPIAKSEICGAFVVLLAVFTLCFTQALLQDYLLHVRRVLSSCSQA